MGSAVGKEAVIKTEGNAIADGIAVALVLVLVVERFRVGEADACALAAGDGELGVGGGEGFAVEGQVEVAAGRYGIRCGRGGFSAGGSPGGVKDAGKFAGGVG